MLGSNHMKPTLFHSVTLVLTTGVLLASLTGRAQTAPNIPQGKNPAQSAVRPGSAPRAPQGKRPDQGAALPEDLPPPRDDADQERDAERVFLWLGPFEPMLKPAQLESFRQQIHERLGEMRVLEHRRRTLACRVLQAAVTADTKIEKLREQATALGQVNTELAMQQVEILRAIQPPLAPEQRAEMRLALVQMFDDGLEPLSFAEPLAGSAKSGGPDTPEFWGLPSRIASPQSVPTPRSPPLAPTVPSGRSLPSR